MAWSAGRRDADPRLVVVSFTGRDPAADPADPCWEGYAPEVSSEPDRVVVRVRAYRSRTPLGPRQACADMGFVRTLDVPLHNPLAGRAVLDGHDGRRHRLAPVRWRRAGCTRLAVVLESGQTGPGGRDAWERTYGPAPTSAAPPAASGVPGDGADGARRSAGRAGLGGGPGGGPPFVRGRPPPSSAPTPTRPCRPLARGPARPGRRAAFPTTPSDRDVAALQDLLVRVARGLR